MIVSPEIRPDEFLPGYRGRVMWDNGWRSLRDLDDAIAASRDKVEAQRSPTILKFFAGVAHITVEQLVQAHTLIPLLRAVQDVPSKESHWAAAIRTNPKLGVMRSEAFFCTACLEEDANKFGTSHWRREHQLPGRYLCPRHSCPLSYVTRANAFHFNPERFLKTARFVDAEWAGELAGSLPVQNFLSISSKLLDRTCPLKAKSAVSWAHARAVDAGLCTKIGGPRGVLFSDYVKKQFDRDWLAAVAPGLVRKPAGQSVIGFDQVNCSQPHSCTWRSIALMCAALNCTAEEMIDVVAAVPVETAEASPKTAAKRTTPQVTDEQVRSAYIACRGLHAVAARRLRLSLGPARERLKAMGLPHFERPQCEIAQKVTATVLCEQLSFTDACRRHGIAV